LDELPPLKFGDDGATQAPGEVDLFSDFDLGSPELKADAAEEDPKDVDDWPPETYAPPGNSAKESEFKLPNLADFELRSKTPKKVYHPRVPASSARAQSPPPASGLSDSDQDSPVLGKRRPKAGGLRLNSSSDDEEKNGSPEIARKLG
jgi:hypothetical protein